MPSSSSASAAEPGATSPSATGWRRTWPSRCSRPWRGSIPTPTLVWFRPAPTSKKSAAIAAALANDRFRKGFALDLDQLLLGLIEVGAGVGNLADHADLQHGLEQLLLGEQLLGGCGSRSRRR